MNTYMTVSHSTRGDPWCYSNINFMTYIK